MAGLIHNKFTICLLLALAHAVIAEPSCKCFKPDDSEVNPYCFVQLEEIVKVQTSVFIHPPMAARNGDANRKWLYLELQPGQCSGVVKSSTVVRTAGCNIQTMPTSEVNSKDGSMTDYTVVDGLANGMFSVVMMALDQRSGTQVIVKGAKFTTDTATTFKELKDLEDTENAMNKDRKDNEVIAATVELDIASNTKDLACPNWMYATGPPFPGTNPMKHFIKKLKRDWDNTFNDKPYFYYPVGLIRGFTLRNYKEETQLKTTHDAALDLMMQGLFAFTEAQRAWGGFSHGDYHDENYMLENGEPVRHCWEYGDVTLCTKAESPTLRILDYGLSCVGPTCVDETLDSISILYVEARGWVSKGQFVRWNKPTVDNVKQSSLCANDRDCAELYQAMDQCSQRSTTLSGDCMIKWIQEQQLRPKPEDVSGFPVYKVTTKPIQFRLGRWFHRPLGFEQRNAGGMAHVVSPTTGGPPPPIPPPPAGKVVPPPPALQSDKPKPKPTKKPVQRVVEPLQWDEGLLNEEYQNKEKFKEDINGVLSRRHCKEGYFSLWPSFSPAREEVTLVGGSGRVQLVGCSGASQGATAALITSDKKLDYTSVLATLNGDGTEKEKEKFLQYGRAEGKSREDFVDYVNIVANDKGWKVKFVELTGPGDKFQSDSGISAMVEFPVTDNHLPDAEELYHVVVTIVSYKGEGNEPDSLSLSMTPFFHAKSKK